MASWARGFCDLLLGLQQGIAEQHVLGADLDVLARRPVVTPVQPPERSQQHRA